MFMHVWSEEQNTSHESWLVRKHMLRSSWWFVRHVDATGSDSLQVWCQGRTATGIETAGWWWICATNILTSTSTSLYMSPSSSWCPTVFPQHPLPLPRSWSLCVTLWFPTDRSWVYAVMNNRTETRAASKDVLSFHQQQHPHFAFKSALREEGCNGRCMDFTVPPPPQHYRVLM